MSWREEQDILWAGNERRLPEEVHCKMTLTEEIGSLQTQEMPMESWERDLKGDDTLSVLK